MVGLVLWMFDDKGRSNCHTSIQRFKVGLSGWLESAVDAYKRTVDLQDGVLL